jgi:Protein of unknown function (DUF1570)
MKPAPISRRSWLLGTLAFSALGASRPDHPELDKIRAKGRAEGMEGFDESETDHYVGIGDGRKKFREEALGICEAVAADYRKYFSEKGFKLIEPKGKLVVVILNGPKSYAMFEGGFVDEAIGGHFDLKENHLVMFDFRGIGANPKAPVAEEDNTLALVHETIHQLTYNTGLLDLESDVPLCVSEGLATFGETWRPRKKGQVGTRNLRRLKGLTDSLKLGMTWIPLATLLADDKLLNDEKTQQIAYAESWLFINKMLKDPAKLPKFRTYLAALREKPEPSKRIEIATTHLGDLEKLDKEIRSSR